MYLLVDNNSNIAVLVDSNSLFLLQFEEGSGGLATAVRVVGQLGVVSLVVVNSHHSPQPHQSGFGQHLQAQTKTSLQT